jgi:uncharacterized protein YndB with AHSA1/START domain
MTPITITTKVAAPLNEVWHHYVEPTSIMQWNAASLDWHTTHAEVDLRVGGKFLSRMEAKDGSFGFDFTGTYTEVVPMEKLAYRMDDGRAASISFVKEDDGVLVTVTFDPEGENSLDMQREGWQAILDRFARFCEST